MTIYFSTILLLFIFSIIDANFNLAISARRMMYAIIYFVLVLQVGLRWETGTDWQQYLNHFKSINDFTSTSINKFEYGYNLFVWLVKLASSKYSFFLLLHAIVFYYLIFKSFQRYSPYFYVSLLMFYTLSMGMMGSNRQLIALAICIFALKYVIDKKPFLFFIFIFCATRFHSTAYLFFIFYFINRVIKPYELILILSLSLIIGMSQLPVKAFSYFSNLIGDSSAIKASIYLEHAEEVLAEYKLSIIGLLKRLVFLFVFYYNRKILSEQLSYYNLMLNGYIFGLVFYFLFADSLIIMIARGGLYFNIMEPLLISSQLCLFHKKENRIIIINILLLFSIIFFFRSIALYSDLFLPYKGIFINSDFYRIMH